jgi:extracellular elastinolytic metalloproteinase
MQALFISLVAGSALALEHDRSPRKSLSFGPVLPHAQFVVNPETSSAQSSSSSPLVFQGSSDIRQPTEPRDIALQFINELTAKYADEGHSYFLREDSYTDSASGVSHFYARQLVQGLEVSDANINLNIYNGKVISFGDSVSVHDSYRPIPFLLTR